MKHAHCVDIEVDLADYENQIIQWVADNFHPEDVFSEEKLREWAEFHRLEKPNELATQGRA